MLALLVLLGSENKALLKTGGGKHLQASSGTDHLSQGQWPAGLEEVSDLSTLGNQEVPTMGCGAAKRITLRVQAPPVFTPTPESRHSSPVGNIMTQMGLPTSGHHLLRRPRAAHGRGQWWFNSGYRLPGSWGCASRG